MLPPRHRLQDPQKQHGVLWKTAEAGGFHKLSGKVCNSLGSHTGRVTLNPTKRPSKTGRGVAGVGGGGRLSMLQKALLGHTPKSNCKNDILEPGFIPSSTSYLLRLQGKDDFSLCQGRTFPACDLKITLCSFCLLAQPKAINHPSKWGLGWQFYRGFAGQRRNPIWGSHGHPEPAGSTESTAFGHASASILHREDA